MLIKVLGAAAGGGLPQWNCGCANCRVAFTGQGYVTPQTQSSIAVSATGESWVLLNASPDLRQQILENAELWPAQGKLRDSPILAVILTNGDVDHIAGLICLREGHSFAIHATPRVLATLASNSMFNVLNPEIVSRHPLALGRRFRIPEPGTGGYLEIEAFAVPGKVALYLEGTSAGPAEGDTIGLAISDGDRKVYYIPGCAAVDEPLADRLRFADLVLFDGTLYTDDEMIAHGLSAKTGARMGHMSMGGPGGSMSAFSALDVRRKIYVHINNSNPVMHLGSPELRAVRAAGWEIGYDGMEICL